MNKTFNKTLSILLILTLIIGLFVVPPKASHAASGKIDIAPSALTTGANVKVSSENSTKKAPFAVAHNGSEFWQIGGTAANVFPQSGTTSSLWLAVDLGEDKTFEEVSFDIPAGFSSVKARMSVYDVVYTSDDTIWGQLPTVNNSTPSKYDWNLKSWKLAKKVEVPDSIAANDPNWGSLTPSNNDSSKWTATTTGTFSTPVTARYVMIHYTLIPGNPGTIGMSNLKILGSPTNPIISPNTGSYVKGTGSTSSTTITLNGASLTGITMTNSVTNSVYLNQTQDYILGAVTGGTQIATFTNTYLDSLPEGNTSLTLYFSGGSKVQYDLSVLAPNYADAYLNNRGSGHAIITPNYPGMSLTIGRPAVVDANAASNKYPVFNVTKALAGTSVTGTLTAPNGTQVYSFPATSVDAGGNAVLSIPDSVALAAGTYKAAFTLTNNGNTLYDNYYFTAINDFANYKSIPNVQNSNNANVANVSPDSWANSTYPAIQMDGSGKITYIPDYKGNQVMDYSSVGYKGGGAAIPNVPVRVKVSPLADNTADAWQTIQDAIDYVSRYPIQEDGFRGSVYLEPGVFRISKPLNVTTSGVVIRGAGAGTATAIVGDGSAGNPYDEQIASEEAEPGVTKLISTWRIVDKDAYTPPPDHAKTTGSPYTKTSNSTLINFNGQGVANTSTSTPITDQYVGAGQNFVHVASVTGLSVGDIVSVQKAVNANWVKAMYMDKVDGASNWLPNGNLESGFAGTPFTAERTIKSIDAANKLITFAEPLSDNLDMRWGIAKVVKVTDGGRISNVGVENIQGISHFYNTNKPLLSQKYGKNFLSYNDENHAQVFVAMVNVRDGWMRNFTTYHIDSAFVTDGNSRNITVQDGNVLDPVSLMDAGERRYSVYYKNSEYMFTQRVYSRYMRHAFIVDSYTSGPNVFYNSISEYTSNASEPHFRWSSGGLYDNVSARIYLQNRWNMGTSHGWAGVNYMLYNFTGPFIASQPQLSPNYVIGHVFDNANNRLGSATDPSTGRQKPDKSASDNMKNAGLNGGIVPNFEAYEYSMTQKVTPAANKMPDSLYVQQLINSHGPQAAANLEVSTVPPMDDQASAERPKLVSLNVGGQPVTGFSPDVYSYTITLPLDYDYSKNLEIAAQADAGVTVDIDYPQDGIAQITLTDVKGMKNFYSVAITTIQKSPIVIASDQQVDSSNSNYAVNVLNPADYAGATSLRWAASGAAWIRMYLGETAKTVNGVQIGFVENPSSPRSYKLRVEYSMDGQNWSFVPSGTVVSNTTASPTSWNTESNTYMNSLTVTPVEKSLTKNTLQTFTFDTPVQARFIRIAGNGNSSNQWNSYWKLRPVFPQEDPEYTPPTGVAITGPSVLNSKDSVQLQAQITPSTATVAEVIWKSSDPAIATVDKNGKVTGVAAGKVTITATTVDGTFVSTGVVQQAVGTYDLTITSSSNADLSSLTLSNGTLSPVFASDTTAYTSSVDNGVSSLSVTASVYDSNATLTVNGNPILSGQASGAINLQTGNNTITVVVTAQNGTTKNYRVTVNRAPAASSNADLSSLTLSSGNLNPAFASDITTYTSSVESVVSSLTLTATVSDSNATMTVNGNPVLSGQASGAINLQTGNNTITVVVTAQNGTTKNYRVTVNRAPATSSNADLSSLTLSNGTLSPVFASGTTAYSANVATAVSSITVTANIYDKNATMTVNGSPVISGQASGAINLQIGSNTINVVVTAQDGTTKTYSIIVSRVPGSGGRGSSGNGGGGSTPSDTKVTATDGKLTLPVGKSGEVGLGNEIVISIPSNATNKELKLTIEKVADTQALLKNKEVLLSSIFEILKNFSENFSNPVTLTFTFNPASLKNNQTAAVFYYDEVKKVWVEVKGSKINGNKISVEVDHFTKYAVFAVDSAAPIPTVNLSDITGHWAEINIKKAVSNGIVSGYPDGTFKPNNTVTRAEFALMLMNTLKPQGEGAALTFTDTAEIGSWAQKAVAQAFQAGIVKGYEDGSFRPNAQITRAEMAVMLANALGLTIEANSVTGFADDKDVPAWAKGAVAAMKKQKLVEGKENNEFAPMASTTRAEAVTVLLNMLAQKTK
ncbi:cadherin-like beta sandwich domain-containing protein [Paenibacillus sp. UNC451MF]|uniref:cadherin-like beta sandwich domain-containing protein n=1 Tax=Paenibacillus sp. UNC451MF TaxID=1449063 RepID=UPI00048C7DFE|nr:cadherin-like beta sandwich domain-containing protein [Paenibacillus sp. UNC451MF]